MGDGYRRSLRDIGNITGHTSRRNRDASFTPPSRLLHVRVEHYITSCMSPFVPDNASNISTIGFLCFRTESSDFAGVADWWLCRSLQSPHVAVYSITSCSLRFGCPCLQRRDTSLGVCEQAVLEFLCQPRSNPSFPHLFRALGNSSGT